jgi:hypothetical protein
MRRHLHPPVERGARPHDRECSRRSTTGDTLIEVIIAVLVLGLASTSLMLGFSTSIWGSSDYRSVATVDTVLRSAAEEVTTWLQQQPSTFWGTCPGAVMAPAQFSLPSGYTAQVSTAEYWNGATFSTTCVPNAAQLNVISVTYKGSVYTISVVVDDPLAHPIPVAGAATKLVFVGQPGSVSAGSALSPPPVVAVEDAAGNIVTTDLSPVSLTVTAGTGTSGATLSTTCVGNEFYGVVTFSGCSLTTAGTGYTLTASDGTLVPATSTPFNVTPDPATQLAFTPTPPASVFAGVQFSVVVTEQDVYGNSETSDSATALSLAASGGGFSCRTPLMQAVTNGVATYSGCSFTNASTTAYALAASSGTLIPATATIAVTSSTATQLVYLTGPQTFVTGTGTAAGSGAVMVQLQNTSGQPVTAASAITLSFNAISGVTYLPTFGSTTACTFSTCTIPAGSSVGTFYMTDSTMNGATISVTTTANGLSATAQTETVLGSSSFGGSVGISSQGGTLSPTGTATYTITVKNTSSSAGYFEALVGGVPTSATTTLTPASSACVQIAGNSSATWSLSLVTNGTSPVATSQFSVVAEGWTASGCSGTSNENTETSGMLTITPGSPSKLVFSSSPPASVVAGVQFSVVVVEQDAYGNTETGSSSTALSLSANNGGGGFSCASTPTNVTNGVAIYTGCYFTVASMTSYALTATSSGLSSASATTSVSVGAATTIVISSGSSQSAVVYTSFASPLVALVTDAYGNPVSGATVTFTAPGSSASGTFQAAAIGGSCLSSGGSAVTACTATTNSNGLASSLTFAANKIAGSYSVATTSSGTTPNPLNFTETNSPDVPPVNNLTLTGQTGSGSYLSGTTVYYKGSTAGSFTLTNSLTDTGGSGPASSTFPTLGGAATGWTHTGSIVSTPANGPYVSATFTWSANTTSSPTETVTGTDNVGNTAVTTLTFVNDTAPMITTTSFAACTQTQVSYSQTTVASGGAGPLTWSISSGSLPSGLSLNSSTGTIAGTVGASATSETFTIEATDSLGLSSTQSLTITVNPVPSVTTSSLATAFQMETGYSQTLASSGGTGAITWSIVSGTLPSGLSLNSSTGAIAGTVAAGDVTETFTVGATDVNGVEGTKSLTITVNKASQTVAFTSTNPSPVTVGGSTYTPTATATSGLTVAFSIDGSSSSGACSISAGVVSFTGVGTCIVDVNQAGNTNWNAASQVSQSITVNVGNQTALIVTSTSGTYGTGLTLTTSGGSGTGAVSYVINSGGTASGCSISSGALSVTSVGTCFVTATKAADSNYNAVSSAKTTITVNPAPLTVTASSGSMTYGGTVPTITASYSGFVNSQSSSSFTTQPTCTTTATRTSAVAGSPYTSSCLGAVDSNYSFTYVAGSVTVNPAAKSTTTSLTISKSSVTYGSETTETFSGTVTGVAGDGYPEGTVAVNYGSTPTQICDPTLTGGSGDTATFTCTLTASQLAAGSYSTVDAVYTPAGTSSSSSNFSYTTSTSTPAQSFTVYATATASVASATSAASSPVQTSSFNMVSGTPYMVVAYQQNSGGTYSLSVSVPGNPTVTSVNGSLGFTCSSGGCQVDAWYFTADESLSTATVSVSWSGGTDLSTIVDVIALGGAPSSGTIVSGSSQFNTGYSTSGWAANLGTAATAGDIGIEIVANDTEVNSGSYLAWNPAIGSSGDLFLGDNTYGELSIYMTSPAVQYETTTTSNGTSSHWGTIATEVAG